MLDSAVNGMNPNNRLSVAVTNERYQPLEGLCTNDCNPVRNGLRSGVRGKGRDIAVDGQHPVRPQVNPGGSSCRDIKLYCAYVEAGGEEHGRTTDVSYGPDSGGSPVHCQH